MPHVREWVCTNTNDGSPDPACETLSLDVEPNPNNVLSAIATITWTGPVTAVSVSWKGGQTPSTSLVGATSPVQLPLLGLAAGALYLFTANGQDADGNRIESDPINLQLGALPAGLHSYAATGSTSDSGLTIVARTQQTMDGVENATIVDSSGTPVWYYLIPDDQFLVGDFQQQIDGTLTLAVNDPEAAIAGSSEPDATYLQVDVLGNLVRTWSALGPDLHGQPVLDTKGNAVTIVGTNEHEIRIQPDGSALLLGRIEQPTDLAPYGGSSSANLLGDVLEHVTQDGSVLYAWNSLDYFGPNNLDPAAAGIGGYVVDVVHANAIDVTSDGNYLVSLRNASQIVKIDATTGELIWRLGGAGISSPSSGGPIGEFTFVGDPLGGFSCQHGARELPNGHIILFDDGDGHSPPQSRGVEYALDTTAMTATMVWESTPSTSLYANIFGFAQRFSDGSTLVTYGTSNMVEEWDPTGTIVESTLADATGPFGLYRSFRIGSLYSYSPP